MIPVIDVFAGPGWLGEGFSSLRGKSGKTIFRIVLSIESDCHAYQTLRLRSFFRQFHRKAGPNQYYNQIKNGGIQWEQLKKRYPLETKAAEAEVWQAELGSDEHPRCQVDAR